MQTLFAMSRDEDLTLPHAIKAYDKSIQNAFTLYLFNIYCMLRVTEMAKHDAEKRHTKYLPTEEDLTFSDKLFTNPLTQCLYQLKSFQKRFKEQAFEGRIDNDLIRKIYREFANEDYYKTYVYKANTSEDDHMVILHDLYRFMRKHDLFNELVEDLYATWEDDKSLVIGAVKKTLKALPATDQILRDFELPEETYDFGVELLNRVVVEDQNLMDIFKPILKNWDIERLALIDMILLKMAICEFMYFKSIPIKVTLNEYVEVAKLYSTSKSKDFINGILDKVMNQLNEKGLIAKEGRGLQE